MVKYVEVNCPRCGQRGALELEADIEESHTKKVYDLVKCENEGCNLIFKVYHDKR